MEPKEENEKPNQRKFLIWITIFFAFTLLLIAGLSYYLVFLYPENQVSQLGITNITEKANFINQYRTNSIQLISTFAQIFGGIAVLIGIYFAWGNLKIAQSTLESNQKNAEKSVEVALANLKSDQEAAQKNIEISLATLDYNIKNAQKTLEIAQEGQITERFTRAIEQLGSNKIEIRLGAIYALERIANESDKDYWPIMKILAAYVRMNSSVDRSRCANFSTVFPLSMDTKNSEIAKKELLDMNKLSDIQVALTILGRRKYRYNNGESEKLDLCTTNLGMINLTMAHFEGANFAMAHLEGTNFTQAHLEGANFSMTHLNNLTFLRQANLEEANLMGASLAGTCLEEANLIGANLMGANLTAARIIYAHLERTNLEGADLRGADLREARNLAIDQLSKAKTLYKAELDEKLEEELRVKGFGHLLDDEPER